MFTFKMKRRTQKLNKCSFLSQIKKKNNMIKSSSQYKTLLYFQSYY